MFGPSFIIPKRSFGGKCSLEVFPALLVSQMAIFKKVFLVLFSLYVQVAILAIQYIHSTVNIIAITSI